MKKVGIDIGASTIKVVSIDDGKIERKLIVEHYGNIRECLQQMLAKLGVDDVKLAVTGANHRVLTDLASDIQVAEDIPAIIEGVRFTEPSAGSVIEIGSQRARYITNLQEQTPIFAINDQCAGGTGSFFEDQMSRLGLKIEDYSSMVATARSIPNISGRCAVFAKTDITHRQQEGFLRQDILLGLCYAMVRNYKAVIVKNLPVKKPIVFAGGVTCNQGVVRAIKDIFKLNDSDLVVPDSARYFGAIGSALMANTNVKLTSVIDKLKNKQSHYDDQSLPKLVLQPNTNLSEPKCTNKMPSEGAYLGIDIGSTSTNLVLIGGDNELIDFQYLRTAGNPEGVVRSGLQKIKEKYGEFIIRGVGVTGSGRERIGKMMGADAIIDEITAQAKAASHYFSDVDTVFEIGGQDSKYISIKDGGVVDFQMNKICAAGTGSFVEEQAGRMNIPIGDFGPLALTSEHPCNLGERCTVFIESAISDAQSKGATPADIAAGLCHSIVKNYLHKVVEDKKVGKKIVLQGGVDYNPGIVAAFQSAYPENICVSPVFSISGAFGVALLAKQRLGDNPSNFAGFDFPSVEDIKVTTTEEIRQNKAFYKKAGQLVLQDYDGVIDPKKKTVGVPLSLIMFKFFPLANAFFKNLGFNVVLSHPTNEETIELAQQYAQGEVCYPVKLMYGHMMQLANQKVDYIFMPRVRTILHPHSHAKHNYACPYMQVAAKEIFDTLGLAEKGIKLLSPIIDLELGAKMMAKAMLNTGKQLGFSKPRCMIGLVKGALAVNKYSSSVEKLGEKMLASLKPDEKVLVLITRNYGIADPALNMGIPEILLSKGYKVMTLGHLPGMSLDLAEDYPHMYWPFGDHLLAGAKLIKNHPNLYAVYMTNHGCGPDTVVSHMFREEMGDKPYLQIEVDEHYSKVGVITRVEAFLNSLSNIKNNPKCEDFDILNVEMKKANLSYYPKKDKKLLLPHLGYYTRYVAKYYENLGFDSGEMPMFDSASLALGRQETNCKEYLPLSMLFGSAKRVIGDNISKSQIMLPLGYGADADGQYARVLRTMLDGKGAQSLDIVCPLLEEMPINYEHFDLLFRALLTADILYCLPADQRDKLAPDKILGMEELLTMARDVAKMARPNKRIFALGSPLCVFSLDQGVLDQLDREGYMISRQPMSEMLYFLWRDNKINLTLMQTFKQMMVSVSNALGAASPFSKDIDKLFDIADGEFEKYAGANGRYRYAKAIDMGERVGAILSVTPRYENTGIALGMSKMMEKCKAPILELGLDYDWDDTQWAKLHSFLYYC